MTKFLSAVLMIFWATCATAGTIKDLPFFKYEFDIAETEIFFWSLDYASTPTGGSLERGSPTERAFVKAYHPMGSLLGQVGSVELTARYLNEWFIEVTCISGLICNANNGIISGGSWGVYSFQGQADRQGFDFFDASNDFYRASFDLPIDGTRGGSMIAQLTNIYPFIYGDIGGVDLIGSFAQANFTLANVRVTELSSVPLGSSGLGLLTGLLTLGAFRAARFTYRL